VCACVWCVCACVSVALLQKGIHVYVYVRACLFAFQCVRLKKTVAWLCEFCINKDCVCARGTQRQSNWQHTIEIPCVKPDGLRWLL